MPPASELPPQQVHPQPGQLQWQLVIDEYGIFLQHVVFTPQGMTVLFMHHSILPDQIAGMQNAQIQMAKLRDGEGQQKLDVIETPKVILGPQGQRLR